MFRFEPSISSAVPAEGEAPSPVEDVQGPLSDEIAEKMQRIWNLEFGIWNLE